jgi:hypothetical protein
MPLDHHNNLIFGDGLGRYALQKKNEELNKIGNN